MATPLEDAVALVAALQAGADEYRQAQLCGYLSVIAVREFEIRIRATLVGHAQNCHAAFGVYVNQDLDRLNGRIKVEEICERLSRFGSAVKKKFVELHQQATADSLKAAKLDAVNAYNSLILNRHQFVHKGSLTLSLSEARRYVDLAPKVLDCVANALK